MERRKASSAARAVSGRGHDLVGVQQGHQRAGTGHAGQPLAQLSRGQPNPQVALVHGPFVAVQQPEQVLPDVGHLGANPVDAVGQRSRRRLVDDT